MATKRAAALCAVATWICAFVPSAHALEDCKQSWKLTEILAGLRHGMSLHEVRDRARKIESRYKIHFSEVFRPTSNRQFRTPRLMATNPHMQGNITVCSGHVVELYFGQLSYLRMPAEDLRGMTLAQAQARLKDLRQPMVLRLDSDDSTPLSQTDTVTFQWPMPGELLFEKVAARGEASLPQSPLLVLAAKHPPPPSGGPAQCPPIECQPAEQDHDEGGIVVVAAGLGAGAAALVMRVAQGGSSPSDPLPVPQTPTGGLPLTRVRHELDDDA